MVWANFATDPERLKTSTNELVQILDKYDDVPAAAGEAKQSIAGPTADQQALPKQPPPTGDLLDNSWLAPEWQGKAPVLCIAGRGPLDEAASSMLAQLLGKHGLGARIVSYDAVSRLNIRALNFRETAMICISYLDIGGNPAHLRYLLRRLRERLPKVLLLVGLWPAQDPILHDQDLRQAIGADYYVSTLREAVETCLAAAKQAARAKPRLVTAGEEAGSH